MLRGSELRVGKQVTPPGLGLRAHIFYHGLNGCHELLGGVLILFRALRVIRGLDFSSLISHVRTSQLR